MVSSIRVTSVIIELQYWVILEIIFNLYIKMPSMLVISVTNSLQYGVA